MMLNPDTELLFPPRLIPSLRDLRAGLWRELVDRAMVEPVAGRDRLAFILLMVKLGGCTGCHVDSYKALRGCTKCTALTIQRFRGSDEELLRLFTSACQEVDRYLEREAI